MQKMLRIAVIAVLVACTLLMANCAMHRFSWSQAMQYKLNKWTPYSKAHLEPYFQRAGVKFPPSEIAFLVFKRSHRFQLYARSHGRWVYIRTLSVLAASGGLGPKLREGDRQVPEGIYHITAYNPVSHYQLSLKLNYPNDFDRRQAANDHRKDLGGNIFIHGNNSSVGCIAVGNDMIRQLFPLVYEVGKANVTVIIAPNDFRISKPVYGKVHPAWLSGLYAQIASELRQFPLPQQK